VVLNVTEGEQVFVDRVLRSGIVHTRPLVVARETTFHAGDPLDESALLDTQRRLYGLALFNEVTTAVQNPDGDVPIKNVLLQLSEARRWNVTYGFGLEAETGTPQQGKISQASAILLQLSPNATYSQEGKTGVSPRVTLDVSRINLRGTDNSLTLHSSYGLLEEVAILTFLKPHFHSNPQFSESASAATRMCRTSRRSRHRRCRATTDHAEGEADGHGHLRLPVSPGSGEPGDACRFRRT